MLKSSSASIVGASRYCCNSDATLLLEEALFDPNLILAHMLLLEVERGRVIGGCTSLTCPVLTPNTILYSSNKDLNVLITNYIRVHEYRKKYHHKLLKIYLLNIIILFVDL